MVSFISSAESAEALLARRSLGEAGAKVDKKTSSLRTCMLFFYGLQEFFARTAIRMLCKTAEHHIGDIFAGACFAYAYVI